MLRLNRFLVSNRLNKASNLWIKSNYYYSSEPPEEVLSVSYKSSAKRPKPVRPEDSETFFRTTNSELNLFGPHDRRAPLYGNIGLSLEDRQTLESKQLIELFRKFPNLVLKSVIEETNERRDLDIELMSNTPESRCLKLFRILNYQKIFPKDMVSITDSLNGIDCSAHDLSVQAIKKFILLFPNSRQRQLSHGFTAVTFSQKTVNDMSGYSESAEQERENFFEKFISDAKNICTELKKLGHWADFIDPYSGQPFLGEPTNETLFETDDRFMYLGFKIEDLGCCKVIYHKTFKSNVIVGTLFTTALANSPELRKLMTDSVNK